MTGYDLLLGALLAGSIAVVAWRARALTASGAVAACVVGALTYAGGTLGFTALLLAFFVPSVVLSRVGRTRKRALVDVGKAGPRDAAQVLANGGVATVCAVMWPLTHAGHWLFAFAGAYAAATADTWATEIGTLARKTPRSILTLRPIPSGLSGGITLPGTLAEVAGACWIGALAPFALGPFALALASGHGFSAIAIGGVVGATLDSVLGATVQQLRRCDTCGRTCETDPHACGEPTRLVRGVPWCTNDVVNLAATVAGAAIAFVLA